MTFGRQRDNDCVLTNDAAISRMHFQIYFQNGACWIRDAGSRNGTYVNDCPIESSQLNSGDEILAGNTRLFVRLTDGAHVLDEPSIDDSQQTQTAIETLLANSKTNENNFDLPANYFDLENFKKLLNELPGLAIILQDYSRIAKNPLYGSIPLENGMVLLESKIELPYEELLTEFRNGSKIFFISHNLTRATLIDRLTTCGRFFVDPYSFWDTMTRLPDEILFSHLEGFNTVVCRDEEPIYAGIYISPDFDPEFRRQMISISDRVEEDSSI